MGPKKGVKNFQKAQKKASRGGGGGGGGGSGGKHIPAGFGGGRKRPRQEKAYEDVGGIQQVLSVKKPKKASSGGGGAAAEKGAAKKHREELQGLAETDPEFFEFLKKNDQALLEFEDDDDDDGEDGEDGEEDEEDEEEDDDDDDDVDVEDNGDLEGMEFGSDDDVEEEEQGDEDDEEEDEEVEEEEEEDEDEEEEEEEESMSSKKQQKKQKKQQQNKSMIEVTPALLASTAAKAASGSLTSLKKLLSMFRSACIPSGAETDDGFLRGDDDDDDVARDADDDDDEGRGGRGGSGRRKKGGGEDLPSSKFVISSPEVYELVMTTVLDTAHVSFFSILQIKSLAKESLEEIAKRPNWRKTQLVVLSFFKSIMHTLAGLAKGGDKVGQGGAVSVFLLGTLEAYVPLLTPMPRLAKAFLKILLTFWSEGPNPSEDESSVRAHAFLRIRQIATKVPGAIAEECFRAMYLTFARVSKQSLNEGNINTFAFMTQSICELYSTDPSLAYQQAFLYIRQLALHLRAAIVKKPPAPESVRQITSWQFVNCLRVWTRVVCALPKQEEELGALAFPLAQIMLGIISAAESVYFLPLKFHLLSCLQQLAAACQMFIPTASKLVEFLELPELISNKPSPSTDVSPKLQYLTRLPTDSVNKVTVRDVLVLEIFFLIRTDAEIYRHHVGLPEYTYFTLRKLRAFGKKVKVSKWRDLAKTLASQIELYASTAKKNRLRLQMPPMQIVDFEPLLAMGGGGEVALTRLMKLMQGRGDLSFYRQSLIGTGKSSSSGSGSSASSGGSGAAASSSSSSSSMKGTKAAKAAKAAAASTSTSSSSSSSAAAAAVESDKKQKKKKSAKTKNGSSKQWQAMEEDDHGGDEDRDQVGMLDDDFFD